MDAAFRSGREAVTLRPRRGSSSRKRISEEKENSLDSFSSRSGAESSVAEDSSSEQTPCERSSCRPPRDTWTLFPSRKTTFVGFLALASFLFWQFFVDPELSFLENLWSTIHFVDDLVTTPCYYAFNREAMDVVRRRANRVMSVALMKEIQPVSFKHTWRLRPREKDENFFPRFSSDFVLSSSIQNVAPSDSLRFSPGIPASIYEHPETLLPPSDPNSFVFPSYAKEAARRATAKRLAFADGAGENLLFSGRQDRPESASDSSGADAESRGVRASQETREIPVSHTSASRRYWRLLPPLAEYSCVGDAAEFREIAGTSGSITQGNDDAVVERGASFQTINITAYFPAAPPYASEDERRGFRAEARRLLRLFALHGRHRGEEDSSSSIGENEAFSSGGGGAGAAEKERLHGARGGEETLGGEGERRDTEAGGETAREGREKDAPRPQEEGGNGPRRGNAEAEGVYAAGAQSLEKKQGRNDWRENLEQVFKRESSQGDSAAWGEDLFEKHIEFVTPELLDWRGENPEEESVEKIPRGRPALFFLHGGGLVMNDHRGYDKLLRRLSNLLSPSGALVFAVDYRLAPEHEFPQPLQDCLQAISFIVDNAKMVGVDPSRLAILGDSGGGSLAAGVMGEALRRVDEFPWAKNVKSLTLVYPSLCRGCATRSQIVEGSLFYLKRDIWFSLLYSPAIGAQDDWRQKPFTTPSALLRQFPTTFLVLFTHDIMYDIGVLFHEKLRRHGVRTGIYIAPGFHGFFGSDRWSRFGVPSVEWAADRIMDNW
ncbi:alpha/beta hydrolase fold domain-containing protein [Toxoplasma gondii RUB]|uniref:Alpha/beta hydrolase fold domain-containing protein n=3 Tax=Toxoplasma gondii TaxID=5811 RepID=A0A086LJU2_TOXGO|nr:alpha/beta hydrolase fold domain-containing protein [Toxoplasma gondii RUB]